MRNVLDFKMCANCGACYNVCPTNAISVSSDALFYEVSVNIEKCVNCGLCQEVCPVNRPIHVQCVKGAYALIHNDRKIVEQSSSGGAFTAIAEMVLEQGGIVYGAVFSDDFKSVKICSTQRRILDDLRRSKYVESQVGYTFKEVKNRLEFNDRQLILYCGTPCQIAGLKRYLNKDYHNLITCDFSCGGVPSHKIFADYLSEIEKKLKSKVCNVNFRPKTYGWQHHAIKIETQNGKIYNKVAISDPYFDCFIGNNRLSTVREYCLNCEFANNHYSDIILADFWKYQYASNIERNNSGISLIISNSTKGDEIIQLIKSNSALTRLDIDLASYNLVNKTPSAEIVVRRAQFLDSVKEKGTSFVLKRIKLRSSVKFKIKYVIKKVIGRI